MKKETLAEFLARGGTIKKIPSQPFTQKIDSVKSMANGGPSSIMSLNDGELYYSEFKPRKSRKKSKSPVDLSALPEELRKKYVDDLLIKGESLDISPFNRGGDDGGL